MGRARRLWRELEHGKRVVLIGPPGSGKGTQGARLATAWGIPHIASGAILRRIIATEDSDLARAARVINEGKYIPDAIANAIAFRELSKPEAESGFLLDGYPRDVAQAEALDAFLRQGKRRIDVAVELDIDPDLVVERLAGRLTCPNCGQTYHIRAMPPQKPGFCDRCGSVLTVREDDQPERIRYRFDLYREKSGPLVAFYREQGVLRTVDASVDEDGVFTAIVSAVMGAR